MNNLSIEISTIKNGVNTNKSFNSFKEFLTFCNTLNTDKNEFLLHYKNEIYNIYDCEFFDFRASLYAELYSAISGKIQIGYNYFHLTLKNVDNNISYNIYIEFDIDNFLI